MKNILQIDIDSERKTPGPVIIAKPSNARPPGSAVESKEMVLLDISCLCEALCTLIHVAEDMGARSSPESLRICIKHLTDGFGDASYIGKSV